MNKVYSKYIEFSKLLENALNNDDLLLEAQNSPKKLLTLYESLSLNQQSIMLVMARALSIELEKKREE